MTGKHDRPRANWVAIEREYGAGQVSLRAIASTQVSKQVSATARSCALMRSYESGAAGIPRRTSTWLSK
ncbi:hypothetical protein CN132_34950 [Sinorhizobium meliloti]|nr:hypothetical protein CN132_34950 [Sinorhizobium meliloti]